MKSRPIVVCTTRIVTMNYFDTSALVNRDVWKKQHPTKLRPLLPELSEFAKHNHNVLHTILRYALDTFQYVYPVHELLGYSLSTLSFRRTRLSTSTDGMRLVKPMVHLWDIFVSVLEY